MHEPAVDDDPIDHAWHTRIEPELFEGAIDLCEDISRLGAHRLVNVRHDGRAGEEHGHARGHPFHHGVPACLSVNF